jgi:hypothetical protein
MPTRVENIVSIVPELDNMYDLAASFSDDMAEYNTLDLLINQTQTLPLKIYCDLLGDSGYANENKRRRL